MTFDGIIPVSIVLMVSNTSTICNSKFRYFFTDKWPRPPSTEIAKQLHTVTVTFGEKGKLEPEIFSSRKKKIYRSVICATSWADRSLFFAGFNDVSYRSSYSVPQNAQECQTETVQISTSVPTGSGNVSYLSGRDASGLSGSGLSGRRSRRKCGKNESDENFDLHIFLVLLFGALKTGVCLKEGKP
jgi:hypothetical protein